MNKRIISALIGLAGAIQNNGKTETTDSIIKTAILNETDEGWVEKLHQEKFRISPGCASCPSPCGNTSDYPMESFDKWSGEQKVLKQQILDEIVRILKNGNADSELPDIVLKGIAYLGYDLEAESYRKLLDEMKHQ